MTIVKHKRRRNQHIKQTTRLEIDGPEFSDICLYGKDLKKIIRDMYLKLSKKEIRKTFIVFPPYDKIIDVIFKDHSFVLEFERKR